MAIPLEAGVVQPIPVEEVIDNRLILHYSRGGNVYASRSGRMAILEASLNAVGPWVDRPGKEHPVEAFDDKARLRISSDPHAKKPVRSVHVSLIQREDYNRSLSYTLRLEKGEEPVIYYTDEKAFRVVEATPQSLDFFRKLVDFSVSPEDTALERYLESAEANYPRRLGEVEKALGIAQLAHGFMKRKDGSYQIDHVYGSLNILHFEANFKDPDTDIALLLHDAPEDSDLFGKKEGRTNSKWMAEVQNNIERNFGTRIARLVLPVTKPIVDGVEIMDEVQRDDQYRKVMKVAGAKEPKILLMKMADRLHNLRTLGALPIEDQIKTIEDTRTLYVPIWQLALLAYPDAAGTLIKKIREQLIVNEDILREAGFIE